jgi:hypothetical protein
MLWKESEPVEGSGSYLFFLLIYHLILSFSIDRDVGINFAAFFI